MNTLPTALTTMMGSEVPPISLPRRSLRPKKVTVTVELCDKGVLQARWGYRCEGCRQAHGAELKRVLETAGDVHIAGCVHTDTVTVEVRSRVTAGCMVHPNKVAGAVQLTHEDSWRGRQGAKVHRVDEAIPRDIDIRVGVHGKGRTPGTAIGAAADVLDPPEIPQLSSWTTKPSTLPDACRVMLPKLVVPSKSPAKSMLPLASTAMPPNI